MRIGVVGGGGRMGRTIVQQIAQTQGCTLVAACERPGAAVVGQDAGVLAGVGPLGVIIGDSPGPLFVQAQVVIDFTSPEATARHAALAAEHGRALVVGTTGIGPAIEAAVEEAARRAAIVVAPNMSLGVNVLLGLVEKVAGILDEAFDIEIVEMHHRHKVDAPSGTALGLGRAAAAGRGIPLEDTAVRSRDGIIGPRRRGDIGFATLRGGDVVGEHTVIFAGDNERVELTHKATSRAIFARGAVRAAKWAATQPPGLYGMRDVLGL